MLLKTFSSDLRSFRTVASKSRGSIEADRRKGKVRISVATLVAGGGFQAEGAGAETKVSLPLVMLSACFSAS